jgi:hypothetical protein
VWAQNKSQGVTTASNTEISSPVPEPPWNELLNVQKRETIERQPHLFRITTPIHINRFRDLLVTHPNRPLTESIFKGLESGFWLWAVTQGSDEPSIVDNAHLQKITDPVHLDFIEEQRDEEINLGCFSAAFDTLSPGMTTIPVWVVPKPHSDKLRLVVDHSAGDYLPAAKLIHPI